MVAAAFCLLGLAAGTVTGFRSGARHRHPRGIRDGVPAAVRSFPEAVGDDDGTGAESSPGDSTSHPWRVVLDIGREPLARMPFDWARQGVRMPLVVPTDFGCEGVPGGAAAWRRFVAPRSDTVGFTGPEGAQESPIAGNGWSVSEDGTVFEASYTLAEELRKRDVVLAAGTELVLTTRMYTQTEIDRLNTEYYAAREAMWSTGGDLNDAGDRQQSSKKWNPATERWEQRYPDENPLAMIKNRVQYWMQSAKQEKAKSQRPEPETLSDRGGKLPGIGDDGDDDEYVYLVQQGVVRYGGDDGPVCGLWTAQPITNVPAWDRGR
mmetsp:Transcript_19556/g.45580  ORF Transcript_19556/g.45580 Transcript_19556/m.45580 type:complete len:321 (+) Transcript_19556:972-1934(+)